MASHSWHLGSQGVVFRIMESPCIQLARYRTFVLHFKFCIRQKQQLGVGCPFLEIQMCFISSFMSGYADLLEVERAEMAEDNYLRNVF